MHKVKPTLAQGKWGTFLQRPPPKDQQSQNFGTDHSPPQKKGADLILERYLTQYKSKYHVRG